MAPGASAACGAEPALRQILAAGPIPPRTRGTVRAGVGWGAGVLLALVSCSRQEGSAPESLLLVTVDTLRADRLGCYGYAGARTPSLDALAAAGVLFENAIAPAPVTLPSHASMLTGLHPAAHALHTNGGGRLDPGFRTLAEALRERVRRSGAVVGSVVLDARFGLDQGFDDYDDRMPPAPPGNYLFKREREARAVAEAAAGWLGRHGGEPFFLWVHFYDPHAPYAPPAPWKDRLADPYDGEIAAVDESLGRLLGVVRASPAGRRTLVVVAGDHGEDLGEHGEATHGVFLYDSTLRVPLIFQYEAGLPRGMRVPGVVRLIDLLPTFLDFFGLPGGEEGQGVSLRPLLSGAEKDLGLEAFSESRLPEIQYGWSRLASLRQRDWMYVRAPQEELYSLTDDPRQRTNRASRDPERAGGLRERLESAGRRYASAAAPPSSAAPPPAAGLPPSAPISEELRRQIESLGYVGGEAAGGGGAVGGEGAAGRGEGWPRVDPKRRVEILTVLSEAGEWMSAGRAAEAEPALRQILAADPGNPFALRLHARALAMLGRQDEARSGYERFIAVAGEDAEALNGLGAIELRAGRLGQAEDHFRRVLEVNPGDARACNNLAFILARRGDTAGALRLLEEVLRDDPLSLDTVLNLALLRDEMGQPQEAVGALRGALSLAPGNVSLTMGLAGVLERRGEREEAATLYRGLLEEGGLTSAQLAEARAALKRLQKR